MQESIGPALKQHLSQSQRHKCSHRFAAHNSDITQTPRQAAMTYRFWRVPITPEVHAFQAEVGGYQHLVIRGNSEDGTVIYYSGDHDRIPRTLRKARRVGQTSYN